ncbi:MAG: YihY/virulence factor BrkB family protein [Crocinitomicaceae bacterium]|nr:YihY/virulence factor BrkB family protein [Crocinitomicaceae bacterium]
MSNKWVKKISEMRLVRKIIMILQSIKPWGFEGMSLWYVSSFFFTAVTKGDVPTRAAAISFRIFLAFFPAIILLLSLIPHIPIPEFQESLLGSIRGFFPGETFSLFESTLVDLISKKHNTLLSIGFILSLYYASSSINAILLGFRGNYHKEGDGDNPILIRIASLILIIVLGLVMVVAISLIIFSGSVFEFLHGKGIIGDRGYIPILNVARWLITLFLVYTVITTLYNVGMGARKRKRWKFINTGATLATIFFVLASIGFAYFVNNFSSFNRLYGSLGTLMVLLIWLNFNSAILLAGFELNTSILKAKKSIPAPKEVPRNTMKT